MKRSHGEVTIRWVWYVIRTLMVVALVAVLGYYAFNIGLFGSNLYIIATEGMQLRAECVMQDGAINEMNEYFTQEFIKNDEALYTNDYDNYTVTAFNYKLEIEGISVAPWSVDATMQIVERVTGLEGAINESLIPESYTSADFPVPAWTANRYKLHFVRDDGRWFISGMELMEAAPSEKPKGTPYITPTPSLEK